MKIKLLLISLLLVSFTQAETVYKTRDAEGNVIFSDVPSEGAEAIEVEEPQTINLPKVKPERRSTIKLVPEEIEYTRLKIVSPENDVTIRSNEGLINISIELTPVLDEAHLIILFMDGKELESGKSMQFSLAGIERGTHTIGVTVKDEEGKIFKRSAERIFHLRKFSKLLKESENDNSDEADNTGVVIAPPENNDTQSTVPETPSL